MTLLLTRSFVLFPLNRRVLALLGSLFFSLALCAQPNLYEFDEELPWDQIVPQKIKTIMVMDCENEKDDTIDKSFDIYAFDPQGKLLSITGYWKNNSLSGENHQYEYDSLGRLAFEFKEGLNNNRQPTVHYYYSYHYDDSGLLKTRYRFVGPPTISEKPRDSVAYHYDEKQQLVKREYFSFRNIDPRIWEMDFENGYGYDKKGRVGWRYGRIGQDPSADTTFIQFDRQGKISTETRSQLMTTNAFHELLMTTELDSVPESVYQNPKYFTPITYRSTYVWSGNTLEVTTRMEGINPLDVNYHFQHNIFMYDAAKKIVASGTKNKSEPRIWTRYFYTYYP